MGLFKTSRRGWKRWSELAAISRNMSAPRHHGPQLPAILESWQPSQLRLDEVDDLIRQDCPALSHLWVAPDERVSVAEVFLGRLVAGVGGPARFHVTAKGDGGVGAPVEEVDEETASSALNSCSDWHLRKQVTSHPSQKVRSAAASLLQTITSGARGSFKDLGTVGSEK